ncbi:MAG: carboxymuconolactone decarboxylase family protein [Nitriliruptoraceae bacterium]|nr:carboxymuconolactone decarboxylase family protein [Nitriliruptoraceae bacterium]
MTRVPIHTTDDAPEASKPPLERQSARIGKTLNIFGAMAHSPTVIGLYDTVESYLAEHTSLEPPVREAVHLTIANVNECAYCQAAYTGAARKHGYSQDQTLQIRRGQVDGDDRLTALLALTRELASNKGEVADATWQAALDAGWSEPELLDAFAEVVRTVLTNWFNHLVHTEQDLPEAPPLD